MAYRNGTYVAFHAGGTSDPTKSDIKYYNTMKMWDASKHIEFKLCDSHEKNSICEGFFKEGNFETELGYEA